MHSFSSSLGRALGAVVALLLCGQLSVADTGSEATDHGGGCLVWVGASSPSTAVSPSDPIRSEPSLWLEPFLLLVLISGISVQ